MTTISHEPSRSLQERRGLPQLLVPELWTSLAIVAIWLSVLFTAIFGPDIHTTSAGGDTATVPSAVVVALFAFLATWVVAGYGFRRPPKD